MRLDHLAAILSSIVLMLICLVFVIYWCRRKKRATPNEKKKAAEVKARVEAENEAVKLKYLQRSLDISGIIPEQ